MEIVRLDPSKKKQAAALYARAFFRLSLSSPVIIPAASGGRNILSNIVSTAGDRSQVWSRYIQPLISKGLSAWFGARRGRCFYDLDISADSLGFFLCCVQMGWQKTSRCQIIVMIMQPRCIKRSGLDRTGICGG